MRAMAIRQIQQVVKEQQHFVVLNRCLVHPFGMHKLQLSVVQPTICLSPQHSASGIVTCAGPSQVNFVPTAEEMATLSMKGRLEVGSL